MLKDSMETNNLIKIHKLNHIGTITLETERLILRRLLLMIQKLCITIGQVTMK